MNIKAVRTDITKFEADAIVVDAEKPNKRYKKL